MCRMGRITCVVHSSVLKIFPVFTNLNSYGSVYAWKQPGIALVLLSGSSLKELIEFA